MTTSLQAQNWCPPGAQWNYSIQGLGLSGYVLRTYVGDTLYDGFSAQRIHETGYAVQDWFPPGLDSIPIDRYAYTSMVDSTLLIRDSFFGTAEWDTLFRFDAQIGDRWYPPGTDSICDGGVAGMVILIDTGQTIIDGVQLRTWTLDYCMENGDPSGTTILYTERLGYVEGMQLLGVCMIVEYGEILTCYSDDEINPNPQAWPYGCASMVGMNDDRPEEIAPPFPNPGTTHFTLQLPGGMHTIKAFDATGRRVLSERTADGNVRIDTEALPPGLYHVLVMDATGTVTHLPWTKQ